MEHFGCKAWRLFKQCCIVVDEMEKNKNAWINLFTWGFSFWLKNGKSPRNAVKVKNRVSSSDVHWRQRVTTSSVLFFCIRFKASHTNTHKLFPSLTFSQTEAHTLQHNDTHCDEYNQALEEAKGKPLTVTLVILQMPQALRLPINHG